MRFVTQYGNFGIKIRDPQARITPYGVEPVMDGIVAEFSTSDWNQNDYETALRSFQMKGLYQYEDEATPVAPTYRIGIYDTEEQQALNGWDDETREDVERRLLGAKSFGRDFVLVQELALEAPWPAYDRFDGTPEELVEQIAELGYLYEVALTYEKSKWGQRRDEVIAALTSAAMQQSRDEIIVTDA